MKIKSTRARAVGRTHRSRTSPATSLQGLVLAAGLFGAVAAGTSGTASAAVKAPVAPMLKANTVAAVTASRPPVGSYKGTNPQDSYPITFYVSADQTSLQDISIAAVGLSCAPGGANPFEPFGMATVPLNSNGSFTATTTQTGVYNGFPAKFTYTFQGNFHGAGPSGAARAAGTFRETMTFTDSAARTCTSDTQSWTAARDTQPPQTKTPPPAGGYTATNPQTGGAITFSVSSSRTSLHNVAIASVILDCAPGNATTSQPFGVAAVPLTSTGSFTATTTQTGVFAGFPAKFTYTFRGNFHSVGSSGAARAAGTFRETMTFTDSAARTCTSNTQSWTAGRDAQPAQTTGKPPAGSYTATNPQTNGAIRFYVSSSQTSLQDISIPSVILDCAPGNTTTSQPFAIAAIPIKTGQTFTATTTKSGVFGGHPAKFTYNFRGNFLGVAPTGAARAAGTFQETMTFTDSAKRTCTSNTQSWTATRNP